MSSRPSCQIHRVKTPWSARAQCGDLDLLPQPPIWGHLAGQVGSKALRLLFKPLVILTQLWSDIGWYILTGSPEAWAGFAGTVADDRLDQLRLHHGSWVRMVAGEGPGWAAHDLSERYDAAERFAEDLCRVVPGHFKRGVTNALPGGDPAAVGVVGPVVAGWQEKNKESLARAGALGSDIREKFAVFAATLLDHVHVCPRLQHAVDFVLAGYECEGSGGDSGRRSIAHHTGAGLGIPEEYRPLYDLIDHLELVGNQRESVAELCRKGGAVQLEVLANLFGWKNPSDNCNSMRQKLNNKLVPHGWELSVQSKRLTANPVLAGDGPGMVPEWSRQDRD